MTRPGDPLSLDDGAAETWRFIDEQVLRRGVVDQEVKELALRYVRDPDGVRLDDYSGRERTALDWAFAIVWDSAAATDDLWHRLHRYFDEPELVDLGCAIGFELGRTHLYRAFGAPHPAAVSATAARSTPARSAAAPAEPPSPSSPSARSRRGAAGPP